jgi:hypothetical protein
MALLFNHGFVYLIRHASPRSWVFCFVYFRRTFLSRFPTSCIYLYTLRYSGSAQLHTILHTISIQYGSCAYMHPNISPVHTIDIHTLSYSLLKYAPPCFKTVSPRISPVCAFYISYILSLVYGIQISQLKHPLCSNFTDVVLASLLLAFHSRKSFDVFVTFKIDIIILRCVRNTSDDQYNRNEISHAFSLPMAMTCMSSHNQ